MGGDGKQYRTASKTERIKIIANKLKTRKHFVVAYKTQFLLIVKIIVLYLLID